MKMESFTYSPSKWVPFRDKEVLERVRKITRADIEKHPNPDFHIMVRTVDEIANIFVSDIFYRIQRSAEENRKVVLILPNPAPVYRMVAHLINTFRVDCRNVWVFAMDEYANENDEIAPDTWRYGLKYAMYHNFYYSIDEDLRPPREQVIGPTTQNYKDYGKMIEDMGNADACYTGPGWTGHLAFIEPDAPELPKDLEEWKSTGPSIVTLSPFTLAQNSLHGSFGKSGDIALLPPKGFTIGPKQIIDAKFRMEQSAITVHGTTTSWQRLITRLAAHGPVTPLVPTSIHQLLKTDYYISEENAADIEPDWDKGY
jgi:glucosamine-6-phosphate deaminase